MRGSQPGERRGGRQRGTKNRRTEERERALSSAALRISDTLGSDAFDGDAHALLMCIYRDSRQPTTLRLDAAKAAIPYEKSRLSSLDARLSGPSLADLVNEAIFPNCSPDVERG
jgi:hypothetical protein